MHVTAHLAKAKDTLVSFEILPPLKGKTITSIYDHLDPLMEAGSQRRPMCLLLLLNVLLRA